MEEISPVAEKSEREFLHALANKITIARGMSEIVKQRIKDKSELEQELNKLEKALKALNEMSEIIVNRRAEIIKHFNC